MRWRARSAWNWLKPELWCSTSIGTAVATSPNVRTGTSDYATKYLVAAAASVAVLAVYGLTVRAKHQVPARRRWGADASSGRRQPIQADRRRAPSSVPPKSGRADRWLARAVSNLAPIEWQLGDPEV